VEVTEVSLLKEAHAKQKGLLGKVLSSPKPYLEDVRSIICNLWTTERQIIAKTGTIHNGL